MKQVHAQTLLFIQVVTRLGIKDVPWLFMLQETYVSYTKNMTWLGLLLPCHYLFYNVYYFLFIQFWVSMTSLKGS